MTLQGNNQVAVITGASSGIGKATAAGLAGSGFRVALGARRVERLADLADEVERISGQRPFVSELDVTDVSSSERFIEAVM